MTSPATSRLKLNPPLGRLPVLQFVPPAELAIDAGYQRGMEDKSSLVLVRRIAQHWNWDLCQPLVVSRRAGGELFVIDGQHRLEAARQRGDIPQLPCVVVEYANAADEAASFVHLNQQRKPLTRLDLFRAAVASEDPQALAIATSIAAAGLTLAPHSNATVWKPGMVAHIGGIERAWRRDGPDATGRALEALARGFDGQVQQYAGTLFRGLVRVCRDELAMHESFAGERFDLFVAMLARQSQADWNRAVKRYFAEGDALFMGEACESLLRVEWRKTQGRPGAPQAQRRAIEFVAPPPPAGFGRGAADGEGEPERAWCSQCDRRVTREKARACLSGFCPMKGIA